GACHDQVDPALQVARDVAGRLALAEPDVARGKVHRGPPELDHAHLEGDARAQARLLEDHGERASGEHGMLLPGQEIAPEPRGEREARPDLRGAEVGDADQIPLHHAESARSSMTNPSSISARRMTSGGRKRSTLSAVQLMRRPSARQRATTG